MRSYFAAPGHEVDVVSFAGAILARQKRAIERQGAELGFLPAAALTLLDIVLGDPAEPRGAPVLAYVNNSKWLAACECGGVEFVDWERPLFMCCSCWNAGVDHAWRALLLPGAEVTEGDVVALARAEFAVLADAAAAPGSARDAIEAALLSRKPANRNWHPGETVADLVAENEAHGVIA